MVERIVPIQMEEDPDESAVSSTVAPNKESIEEKVPCEIDVISSTDSHINVQPKTQNKEKEVVENVDEVLTDVEDQEIKNKNMQNKDQEKQNKNMQKKDQEKQNKNMQNKDQEKQNKDQEMENKDLEEYLKKYDQFEGRNNYSLWNINVPEKIILMVDRGQDQNSTHFLASNAKFTPMTMLRRALHLFVKLKHSVSKNQEFAVALLNENNVTWSCSFTNDLKKIHNIIDTICLSETEETFDMESAFQEIFKHCGIPEDEVAPPFVIRAILFYGRSNTIPNVEFSQEIQGKLESPFFTCDVLMTHEPESKNKFCKPIFEALMKIDKKGLSYFLPVERNILRLHNSIAKLLGHSLQRPLQTLQKI